MSLNYLLDGYNIIHLLPRLSQKNLEDARDSLISLLETQSPQGSRNNKVTVVFDGQLGMYGQPRCSFVKVVFSCGESADDYIKRAVASSVARKSIVVVTNDKDIKLFVRALGAQVLSVEDFMKKTSARAAGGQVSPRGSSQGTDDLKYIPKTIEHSITAEFEDIWIKKIPRKK